MTDSQVLSQGLLVRDLEKHFDGVQAVRGVSFSLQPGECVALIGPNGAGKSTTFACIAGQHAPSAGQLLWRGALLNTMSPAHRLQRGIARTFQVAQIFESLTVLQNVQLLLPGTPVMSPLRLLDNQQSVTALALLARVGLHAQAGQAAGQLPYGAKKRLELAMALAGLRAGSGLLLLDEPAAGLAPFERAELMQLVRSLAHDTADHERLAVLYTEHNMDAVFGIADRVLVLMEGRLVATGTAEEVASNGLVLTHYLGRSFGKKEAVGHA